MATEIELPSHGWLPRRHQAGLWTYLQEGGKRAMAVWHRRAGKDLTALNWTVVESIPVHDDVKVCAPGHDRYVEAFIRSMEAVSPFSMRGT